MNDLWKIILVNDREYIVKTEKISFVDFINILYGKSGHNISIWELECATGSGNSHIIINSDKVCSVEYKGV